MKGKNIFTCIRVAICTVENKYVHAVVHEQLGVHAPVGQFISIRSGVPWIVLICMKIRAIWIIPKGVNWTVLGTSV